jgi:hypothetical protein
MRQDFLESVWVVKDQATGVVHAVFKQMEDFGKGCNTVRIYDDYKGGLVLEDDY